MESGVNAPHQMLLIERLAKVTNDAIPQSAYPDVFIGVGCHEDRRNLVARLDEAFVKLKARHRGHMDVGDQTGGFDKARGGEEIGSRRKGLDAIAQ
jgi:hypothetical protein